MNLLPNELRSVSAKRLVDKIASNGWRLNTGFLGTPYLLEVLADNGYSDLAYRLLLNTEYPSWGYLVEHGATTMWERWNGDQMRGDPSMNSYNHYAYGAVAEWIYRYAAGVDTSPLDPGFHTIVLRPTFDSRLKDLDFSYQSPYGRIHSAWSIGGSNVSWKLTVPPNSIAWLPVPADRMDRFSVDGEPLARSGKVRRLENGEGLRRIWRPVSVGGRDLLVAELSRVVGREVLRPGSARLTHGRRQLAQTQNSASRPATAPDDPSGDGNGVLNVKA
jgi:alpha-L-rhamnosidase